MTGVINGARFYVVFTAGLILASGTSLEAASPLVYWSARTVPGSVPGTITADWVGTSATVSVTNNFTYISALIDDACAGGNKFVVRMRQSEGVPSMDVAEFYTRPGLVEYNLFAAAGRLSFWGSNATFSIIKAVEARFTQCAGSGNLTIVGFNSDGAFLAAPSPARRIEVIGTLPYVRFLVLYPPPNAAAGDSISAGDLVRCTDVWGDHIAVNNSLCVRCSSFKTH